MKKRKIIMGFIYDQEKGYMTLDEYDKQIRAYAIEECAELFANTLSNMTQICGNNCPIKCNWGTEETCKDMCKKWFIKQLKEQKWQKLIY